MSETAPKGYPTVAQIEAAARGIRRSLWARWGASVPAGDESLSSLSDDAVEGYLDVARRVLADVVSTEEVIVRRDDLAAVVAFVRVMQDPASAEQWHEAHKSLTPDVLDRLAAVLKP